jgi:phage tail sheath gpL-like
MIDFNEIPQQLTPDVLIETDWTSGLSGLPSTVKRTLLSGYKLDGGSLANGIVKPIVSRSQARQWWGDGSHLAVMAEAFLDVAPGSLLYGASYPKGANAQAATRTLTLEKTATTNGTLKVWIGGRLF